MTIPEGRAVVSALTDADERAALLAGASALRLRAELIANRTNKPEPPDVATAIAVYRRSAEVLEEMADCYAVQP